MASYSNILAYEIPLTEEPGMLQVHEVARVGHMGPVGMRSWGSC